MLCRISLLDWPLLHGCYNHHVGYLNNDIDGIAMSKNLYYQFGTFTIVAKTWYLNHKFVCQDWVCLGRSWWGLHMLRHQLKVRYLSSQLTGSQQLTRASTFYDLFWGWLLKSQLFDVHEYVTEVYLCFQAAPKGALLQICILQMAIAEMETTDTSPNVIANEVSLADYGHRIWSSWRAWWYFWKPLNMKMVSTYSVHCRLCL